jgi:small subunit ribosomal protein S25e
LYWFSTVYESMANFLASGMQITGSLARRAIKELMAKGTIRLVAAHANQQIYTRATNT